METNLLTKSDHYRRTVSHDLAEAYRRLGKAQVNASRAVDAKKAAESIVNEIQGEINDLVSCLTDIENGQYQPTLFDERDQNRTAGDKKPPADDGAEMHVEALADHGLSQHEISVLRDCELELTTIGKLERAMREDANWHRKIKGFGQAKIDKLTDALLRFREAHPVPTADDCPFTVTDR